MNDKVKALASPLVKFMFYVLELWIFAMATILLLAWTSNVTGSMWFGGSITVLAMGNLFLAGLVVIESNPPHEAVRTFLTFPFVPPLWMADRFGHNLRTGFHWLFPGLFWGIPFDMTEGNVDLFPKDVITQDGVVLEAELSYGMKAFRLLKLLFVGGNKRVQNFLDDIFEEIMREEAYNTASYEEFLNHRRIIARKMAYSVWEKYGAEELPKRGRIVKAGGGSDDEVIASIASELDKVLSGEYQLELTLGVKLTRLNLGTVGIPPKLLESLLRAAEEKAQLKPEAVELEFTRKEALKYMAAFPGMSYEEAFMYVQTERPQTAGDPKVKKEIREVRLTAGDGINLKELVGAIAAAVGGRGGS